MIPIPAAAQSSILLQEAVTLTMPARTPLHSWCTLKWYSICLSWIRVLLSNEFWNCVMMATRKPDAAAEMTVFMTTWFGLLSSVEIYIYAPAFIKSEVIRMIRVPAKSMLMSEAKKVRLLLFLYILNISNIYLYVSLLYCGNSRRNRATFLFRICYFCYLVSM